MVIVELGTCACCQKRDPPFWEFWKNVCITAIDDTGISRTASYRLCPDCREPDVFSAFEKGKQAELLAMHKEEEPSETTPESETLDVGPGNYHATYSPQCYGWGDGKHWFVPLPK